MEKFFKSYFEHFKYQSIDYYQFKSYFIEFCLNNSIPESKLNEIDWNLWIFTPGDIPVKFEDEKNKYKEIADEIIDKIKKEEFENLATEFNNLSYTSKTYILLTLDYFEGFLTDKQHQFLTETLQLYHNQNFFVSTYYFILILEKTDKF